MKLCVIYSSSMVREGYGAWVLYPFMFFRDAQEDVSDRLFRHEMEHVYQVQRIGWWRFYITYLWLLWKHGYADHPYELEAIAAENEKLTTVERYFKDD